jgi:hypothetical protein
LEHFEVAEHRAEVATRGEKLNRSASGLQARVRMAGVGWLPHSSCKPRKRLGDSSGEKEAVDLDLLTQEGGGWAEQVT